MLRGKHIILGITGGIAAYKSVSLLRLFVKAGAEVQVVITPSGKEFITPVTLSALSGRPVICDFFTANTGVWNSHVDLGLWADAMVIAPATASSIAKMANGVADNMLITTYLSDKDACLGFRRFLNGAKAARKQNIYDCEVINAGTCPHIET